MAKTMDLNQAVVGCKLSSATQTPSLQHQSEGITTTPTAQHCCEDEMRGAQSNHLKSKTVLCNQSPF